MAWISHSKVYLWKICCCGLVGLLLWRNSSLPNAPLFQTLLWSMFWWKYGLYRMAESHVWNIWFPWTACCALRYLYLLWVVGNKLSWPCGKKIIVFYWPIKSLKFYDGMYIRSTCSTCKQSDALIFCFQLFFLCPEKIHFSLLIAFHTGKIPIMHSEIFAPAGPECFRFCFWSECLAHFRRLLLQISMV